MKGRLAPLVCTIVCIGLFASCGSDGSVELAKDYYQHGLNERAKETLIAVLHTKSTERSSKAKTLYMLGQISFDEGRIQVALGDWKSLVRDYPDTSEAREINGRLKQLSEIVGKLSDTNISSLTAQSYMSNGNFWSGSDHIFHIDSSWLPDVELALQWYDRIIEEFPNSDAAELAYERKMFALIGWKDAIGDSHGLRADFAKYMPQVLDTFSSFESTFPSNSSLQAFRYQIAQAYWERRDWANTKLWLGKVIEKSNGESTFYTETAKARLQKLEH